MTKKNRSSAPETPATRMLRDHAVPFTAHFYEYQAHGGTRVPAQHLEVDEHRVIKTLIMENESGDPLIVLMHGDRTVSTKSLARRIGCKKVAPCQPETANRHSGYLVGGTSPFGIRRKDVPVYVEKSILALPTIFINGGRRGMLLQISPSALLDLLQPETVECGIEQ
ncbi:MAG: aminoacyl-tRNA deacylase [Rhodocyclaceae bacterium]|nr:aminoacyl-tRNA deacylase [Rhodocyclaceae bacterium]